MVENVQIESPSREEDISKKVAQGEVDRMQDALDKAKASKKAIPLTVELYEKLLDISKKAQKIQLDKFKKLNFDFEYEKDEEFIELMKQKQEVLNNLNNLEKEQQIEKMKSQKKELENHIEYYEMQIKNKKEQYGLEE